MGAPPYSSVFSPGWSDSRAAGWLTSRATMVGAAKRLTLRCSASDAENLLRREARRRDQVLRAPQHEGQRVEARAVRHRRGVQADVLRPDPVDIGEVGPAHRQQVAMRQHRALGPAGRARGVEDPGRRLGRASTAPRRRPPRAARPSPRRDGQDRARCELAERLGQRRAGDAERRLGVVEDPGVLARVQPGVDRDRGQPGAPDAEQHRQELGPVLHDHARRGPPAGTRCCSAPAIRAAWPSNSP